MKIVVVIETERDRAAEPSTEGRVRLEYSHLNNLDPISTSAKLALAIEETVESFINDETADKAKKMPERKNS